MGLVESLGRVQGDCDSPISVSTIIKLYTWNLREGAAAAKLLADI